MTHSFMTQERATRGTPGGRMPWCRHAGCGPGSRNVADLDVEQHRGASRTEDRDDALACEAAGVKTLTDLEILAYWKVDCALDQLLKLEHEGARWCGRIAQVVAGFDRDTSVCDEPANVRRKPRRGLLFHCTQRHGRMASHGKRRHHRRRETDGERSHHAPTAEYGTRARLEEA